MSLLKTLRVVGRNEASRLLVTQPEKWNSVLSICGAPFPGIEGIHLPAAGYRQFQGRKLCLKFSDVERPNPAIPRYVPASLAQVRRLIKFGREVHGNVLVHCFAGQSRSSAAGYILLVLAGRSPRNAITELMRCADQGTNITPNRRLIWMADYLLEQRGEMIKAYQQCFGNAEPWFVDWEYPRP